MPRVPVDVVHRSSRVSPAEVRRCIRALRVQIARDFAPVWGRSADLRYVGAVGKGKGTRARSGAWQLVLLDQRDVDDGYHELTKEGLPLGKVFLREAQSTPSGWTSTASHELLELLANPDTTLSVFVEDAGHGTRVYPFEVCDPCQDDRFTYRVEGVPMSDFVHPAWFEPWHRPRSVRFDHAGHLHRPFEVPRACYAQFFDARTRAWRDDWGGKKTPHLAVYGSKDDRGGSRRPLRAIPREKWRKSRA